MRLACPGRAQLLQHQDEEEKLIKDQSFACCFQRFLILREMDGPHRPFQILQTVSFQHFRRKTVFRKINMVGTVKNILKRLPQSIFRQAFHQGVDRLQIFPEGGIVKQIVHFRLLEEDLFPLQPDGSPENINASGLQLRAEERHIIPGYVDAPSFAQDFPGDQFQGTQKTDTQLPLDPPLNGNDAPLIRGSEAARPGRRFKAVIGARIIADQVAHGPDPGFLKIQGRLRPNPPDYCYR